MQNFLRNKGRNAFSTTKREENVGFEWKEEMVLFRFSGPEGLSSRNGAGDGVDELKLLKRKESFFIDSLNLDPFF
jgi:hypothetical protein